MTPRSYSARDACDVGFVTWVLPKDDLDAYVADLSTKIVENVPISVKSPIKWSTSFKGSHIMVMP